MNLTALKQNKRICFITETDLKSQQITGAVVNDLKMLRHLKKFGDVDVVYLQKDRYRTLWSYLPIYVMQILRSLSKPYRVYFTRSIIASFIVTSLGTKKGKVIHLTFSVPFTSTEIRYLKLNIAESIVRFKLYNFFERKAFPKVDIIITAADVYAEALTKIGIKPSKIHILPFFVEDNFFNQPMKRASEIFTFCYIGGFHLYHSLLPLVEAFELLWKTRNNVNLLFVGNGPQRPKLKREVERRKLTSKVRFLGKVPHSSLPSFLSKIDCVVSLIRKSGISISLLESAASAKAIIAFTPDNTLKRYFRHGEHIYLVNALSPHAIADAMEMIYKKSSLRNTLAKGAREVAQQHFNERVFLRHLQALMETIYKED